ncbi:MAG: mercury(II) reductase [Gemmatimonadota bacterium]
MKHLFILGGGSGAFAAAIRAAELGARVTMVERDAIGGTCVNRGCVPSKTLIRAAEVRHLRSGHAFAGISAGDGRVEMGALVRQKRELVARVRRSKYRDVLDSYQGIEYVRGEARFVGPEEVTVRLEAGGQRRLRADRIVIATGARPWVPAIPGIEEVPYWTNEEALEAEELPDRLLVAGGGPVGLELAQLFARLGSRVTLVAPRLAPGADPEVSAALAGCLHDEGLVVHLPARLRGVLPANGELRCVAEVEGRQVEVAADRILLATGRVANTGALNLTAAGVQPTRRGFISVDRLMRTYIPHIYAVGDCTTLPKFVYVAAKAGTIAAENALAAGERELDLSAMPAVIFTDPQVAWVGLTEAEARAQGTPVLSRTLPLEHVPRALANRDTRGLLKIVARESDGRILGVHALMPSAGEVIQTAVLAVKLGLTTDDLADALFPYLTEVEGLKLAAQTFTRAIERLSCCAG